MSRNDCLVQLAELCGVRLGRRTPYDWAAIEGSLTGLTLPSDYKELAETFPNGRFRDLVRPIRPGDVNNPVTEYLGYYAYRLDDMRTWREGGFGEFPYPIYPEPGGLLPWAEGPGGEMCFWLTAGADPQSWPVVSADRDFMTWQRFPGSMCEFLLAFVRGTVDNPFEPGVEIPPSAPFTNFETAQEVPLEPKPIPAATAGPRWGVRLPENEFAELSKVVPVDLPAPPPTDWPALEGQLGVTLPADHKSFVDVLGTGTFCDIRILGLDPCGEYDLPTVLRQQSERASRSDRGRTLPYHPQPDGVIPWGVTGDGWTFAWRFVDRDPGEWPVVMVAPDYTTVFLDELSFSSFLLKYCGHRDQLGVFFARPPWAGAPTFVPHRH
jgi:hypothetical protein